MNVYNEQALIQFRHPKNIKLLHNRLMKRQHDFSLELVDSLVFNFAGRINDEYVVSRDTKEGNQLECLNAMFIKYVDNLANDYERQDKYTYVPSDGIPRSQKIFREPPKYNCEITEDYLSARNKYDRNQRTGQPDSMPAPRAAGEHKLSTRRSHWRNGTLNSTVERRDTRIKYSDQTDEILESWRNPRRGVQMRDDSAGTTCVGKKPTFSFDCEPAELMTDKRFINHAVQGNKSVLTNKQESLPLDMNHFHHTQFMNSIQKHNDNILWAKGSQFTDDEQRLLDREVFRSVNPSNTQHTDSTAAQIPFYRKSIQHRYNERDVDESIGGFESGCLNRGYDMNSLYCRIDAPIRQTKFSFKV